MRWLSPGPQIRCGRRATVARLGPVGSQHRSLGLGLGPWVVGQVFPGYGSDSLPPSMSCPARDDARRAGEHQPADPVLAAGGDDVLGADDIDLVILVGRPPDAGLGRDVEDGVAPGDGPPDRGRVGDVALHLFDAESVEGGVR